MASGELDRARGESFQDFLKTLSFCNIIKQEEAGAEMASREWMKQRFASFLQGPVREWEPGTLEFCRASRPELADAICKGFRSAERMIKDGAGAAEFETAIKGLEESCVIAMRERSEERPF